MVSRFNNPIRYELKSTRPRPSTLRGARSQRRVFNAEGRSLFARRDEWQETFG
jgi:hypothetical protein